MKVISAAPVKVVSVAFTSPFAIIVPAVAMAISSKAVVPPILLTKVVSLAVMLTIASPAPAPVLSTTPVIVTSAVPVSVASPALSVFKTIEPAVNDAPASIIEFSAPSSPPIRVIAPSTVAAAVKSTEPATVVLPIFIAANFELPPIIPELVTTPPAPVLVLNIFKVPSPSAVPSIVASQLVVSLAAILKLSTVLADIFKSARPLPARLVIESAPFAASTFIVPAVLFIVVAFKRPAEYVSVPAEAIVTASTASV